MSSTRKETTWCTLCGARFTHAEIDGYACCPKCGDTSLPCDTNDDVSVVVNWHELRILGIWAENWAHACQTRNPGGSKEARPEVIHAITRRLQRQYPENTALTLSGEIMQIKDGGLDIEGSGIAKNSVLPVNGPGAAPPSEAPLTGAERDEALATGHADLLIDVGPCGMAYRELVARAEAAEASLERIMALGQAMIEAEATDRQANTGTPELDARVMKLRSLMIEAREEVLDIVRTKVRAKVEGEGT